MANALDVLESLKESGALTQPSSPKSPTATKQSLSAAKKSVSSAQENLNVSLSKLPSGAEMDFGYNWTLPDFAQKQQNLATAKSALSIAETNLDNTLLPMTDKSLLDRMYLGAKSINKTINATPGVVLETAKQASEDFKAEQANEERQAAQEELIKTNEKIRLLTEAGQIGSDDYKALTERKRQLEKVMADTDVSTAVDINNEAMQDYGEALKYGTGSLEGLEGGSRMLGQAALSIGQNAALLPLGLVNPLIPAAAMGTMASAGKMYELSERGIAAEDALSRGALTGLIETLTEKIPLDNLMDILKVGGKGALKNIIRQTVTEAGEEGASYIANLIADKAAKDPDAKFSSQELIESMLIGGISGGIMGGGTTLLNRAITLPMVKPAEKNMETPAIELPAPQSQPVQTVQQETATVPAADSAPVLPPQPQTVLPAEGNPSVQPPPSQGPESSVGAAKMGFSGDTERGFGQNVASNEMVNKWYREWFSEDLPMMYFRLGNAETLAKAEGIMSQGLDSARATLESAIEAAKNGGKLSPEMVPLSVLVANGLAENGDYFAGANILEAVGAELTAAGQLSQAANILRQVVSTVVAEAESNLEKAGIPVKPSAPTGADIDTATDAIRSATEEVAAEIQKGANKPTRKGGVGADSQQAGEPFVFEYEGKVGEALGKAMASRTTPKAPSTTFVDDILSQLKKFAGEKVGSGTHFGRKNLTAIERLRDYLQNKDFYRNAWEQAQLYLREKYANDEFMLNALDSFINESIGFRGNLGEGDKVMLKALVEAAANSGETASILARQEALGFEGMSARIANELIEKTGATGEDAAIIADAAAQFVNRKLSETDGQDKLLSASVKSALSDIKAKLSELAVSNQATRSAVAKQVADLLIQKYGMPGVNAENVANTVSDEFFSLVKQAADRKLKSIFGERSAPNQKSFEKRLDELFNLGAFDSEAYRAAATEWLSGAKVDGAGSEILNTVAKQAFAFNNLKRGDKASLKNLIIENSKIRKTTGLFSNEVGRFMDKALDLVADMDGGEQFLRDIALSQIRNIAKDYTNKSVLNKAKNFRINNMLSKAATVIRNLVSNNVFDPLESLANNTGVIADMLMETITGRRTTAIDKSWASSAKRKGSLEGLIKSFIEVSLDVDAESAQNRLETAGGRAFKMTGNPVERLLSTWAKYSQYALVSTDELQKGGIRAETQRGIDSLKAAGKLEQDALPDWANETARQRTFQNDSRLATAMGGVREAGNKFSITDKHGGSIGAGDILLPFARVTANIATQFANYSPLGLVNGVAEVGKALKMASDLKTGKLKDATGVAEAQAQAARDIGRSVTGTAILAAFSALAKAGILSVAGADDKDKEALESAEGKTGTQINVSALGRFLSGGSAEWQEGDTLASVGFLEPINGIMALAALIAEDAEDGVSVGDIAQNSWSALAQTMLDLPAMSQINALINGYTYSKSEDTGGKLFDAFSEYGASQVSSFLLPNALRGIATGMDNTVRNAHTGDGAIDTAVDNIKSGIPGLRNTLPASIDPFGREKTYTGDPVLNFLNANILPGQVTKYKQDAVTKGVQNLYERTGNAAVYPKKSAPSSFTYNNKKVELDADGRETYQRTYGQTAYDILDAMQDSRVYKSANDERKAELVSLAYEYATALAKASVSAYEPTGWTEKAIEAAEKGVDPADYIVFQNADKDIDNSGSGTPSVAEYIGAADKMFDSAKERNIVILLRYPEWAEKAEAAGVEVDQLIQYKRITAAYSKKADKIAALRRNGLSASQANAWYKAFK